MKDLKEYILESIILESNPTVDDIREFLIMLFGVAENELNEKELSEIQLWQHIDKKNNDQKLLAKGFKREKNKCAVAEFLNEFNSTLEYETENNIFISWPKEIADKYFNGDPALSVEQIIKDIDKFKKLKAEYQKILKKQ